jgi:hypothetical protein
MCRNKPAEVCRHLPVSWTVNTIAACSPSSAPVADRYNHAWGAAIVSSLKNRGIPLKVAAKRVAVALDRKDTPIKSDRRSGQHWKRVINLRKDLQRKKPKPHQIDMKLIYDDTVQWLDVSPEMGEDWLSDSD